MTQDLSVLYYTSNREAPAFEKKITDALIAVVGGNKRTSIPIISVSQKPIDLGRNICVGDVGPAYANEYRQILIGAQEAKTTWIAAAESDCLYPPSYFNFTPPSGDIWRYDNVWILWRNHRYSKNFCRKRNSEGAQIVRREFLIERLTTVMAGLPEWHSPDKDWDVRVYGRNEWQLFGEPDRPVISVKSGQGMRPSTQVQRNPGSEQPELPFWGSADVLRKELFS